MNRLLLLVVALTGICYAENNRLGQRPRSRLDRQNNALFDQGQSNADSCPVPLECPGGYSGRYCDRTMCVNRGFVRYPDPDIGYPIDIMAYKTTCAAAVNVRVDSHMSDLFLMIDGQEDGANPTLTLTDMTGTAITPYQVLHNDSKSIAFQYDITRSARGIFMARFSASKPCIYQAHALTDLIVPVAFVSGHRAIHNDHPDYLMTQGEQSYAIAHGRRLQTPGYVRALEVFADNELVHGYDPMYRYGCSYEMYFGPMMCNVGTIYYYKVYGVDENGYDFMRTDTVECRAAQITTTHAPPPSTTPDGPCEHGGTWDGKTCFCPPTWTGQYCHDIICLNGGTPTSDNQCMCPGHYGGHHCSDPICTVPSPTPIFSPNFRSMAFVVQATSSQANQIAAFKDYISSIIEDFVQHHPNFIVQYSLHVFDDKEATTSIVTGNYEYIMEYVHHIVVSSEAGDCKKRSTSGLIHALSNTLPYGSIYVFTDSPDVHDINETLTALNLLGMKKAKLNYFLTAPRCGNMSDLGYQVYYNFAQFTGGQVFKVNDNNAIFMLLNTIQTIYQDTTVNEGSITDCTKKQVTQIPIDSRTVAFTVSVHGYKPNVTIYSPTGAAYKTVQLVTDDGVQMVQAITPCDDGWVQHEHNCFHVSIQAETWRDAQNVCKQSGGSLVTVLNQEKQVFLESTIVKNTDYWTGLNDINVEGLYNWDTNGQPIPVGHYYLNWGAGQPDDGSHSKNCIFVKHNGTAAAQWFNRACTDKVQYICEKHAYDEDRNRLPFGVWRAEYTTQNGGDSGSQCYLSVHSQSDLQVYYGFGVELFSDFPNPEPFFNSQSNYMMAHVTGINQGGRFMKTQFYTYDFQLLQTLNVNRRENCAYTYITDLFICPKNAFGIVMNGEDDNRHPWSRIRSAVCMNDTTLALGQQLAHEAIQKYEHKLEYRSLNQ